MTTTGTPRPLNRPPLRCGVRAYRPRRRAPEPTRLGWALLIALVLLAAGVGIGASRAQEGDDAPRFAPTSRGSRVAATEAVQRWRPLVSQYPWDVEVALRVIACESEGSPTVWNRQGSGAHGLFQLLGWEWLAFRMFGVWSVADPAVNTAVAHVIWRESGGRFDTRMGWAASAGCWSW